MYLNKEQLTDEINDYFTQIEGSYEQTLEVHPRHGITGKVELGEFAFPYFEFQEDYDMLMEDHTESSKAECGYDGEIQYVEWSSKSGTSVFVDGFEYEGYQESKDFLYDWFESEYGFSEGSLADEFSREELLAIYRDAKLQAKLISDARAEYDEMLVKVEKIIESTALGVRSGCFSNGEVIFSPTEAYEGANADFTPYYNPNEEVA